MTLWEIYNQAWDEWIKYHEETSLAKNARVKGVKRDPDQERILWELGVDEYFDESEYAPEEPQ